MASYEELKSDTESFFTGNYEISEGDVIPDVDDIELGNKGKRMNLAMLFIDIRESTKIVDGFRRVTAAKMYKSFLSGVAKIARNNGGEVRSFNGDGVLVVFSGGYKCTSAAKTALQMSSFVNNILAPKLKEYFENNSELQDIEFSFGVGVHTGTVLVVRGGIRGENNNDLVWVGNATNYAVKLSDQAHDNFRIHISEEVFNNFNESIKRYNDKDVWVKVHSSQLGMYTYHTNWTWNID